VDCAEETEQPDRRSNWWEYRSDAMVALVEAGLVWLILVVAAESASAQGMADLFGKVAGTVVVIQATGRDTTEIGSGVLISPDGKIMTAAHLVHGAAAVAVKFLGGRTVPAQVVASELAADLSLIQLDQVPAGLRAATLANSDQVRVGDQVIVVGAPYGLEGQLLSNELADLFNLPPKTVGFLVKAVAKGSPAESMGVRGGFTTATVEGQPLVVGGDIILTVEGLAVNSAAALARIREHTSRLKTADPVTMTVLRAGQQLKLIGKMP
jgi:S1-C subfamily serine protease